MEMPVYCRGEKTRREIVKTHELLPVAHVQLLAGQAKKSCTGDDLTDTYYCFSYKLRGGTVEGTLLCGKHAANDFLQLIGHSGLPLFNPLQSSGGGGTITQTRPQVPHATWDPTAKQLLNAIQLLIVCWSTSPGVALAAIKGKLENAPGSLPSDGQIKAINTILGKDMQQRSLTQMLREIAKNNAIKTYDFSLLDAALARMGIVSKFT